MNGAGMTQAEIDEAIRSGAERMMEEREVLWNLKYKQYHEKLLL